MEFPDVGAREEPAVVGDLDIVPGAPDEVPVGDRPVVVRRRPVARIDPVLEVGEEPFAAELAHHVPRDELQRPHLEVGIALPPSRKTVKLVLGAATCLLGGGTPLGA